LILIGTAIFCALLFATPGLYKLYENIKEANKRVIPPFEFMTKSLSWKETGVDVTFTLVLTNDQPSEQAKTYSKDSNRIFVAAELTNTKDQAVDVTGLDFTLECGKVELLNHPFMSYSGSPITLKPKEVRKLQASVYMTKETLMGLVTEAVTISGKASFSEGLKQ